MNFTEQTYTRRRAELVDHIRVAKDDHARASLKFELGNLTDPAEVAKAREAITALEDRVLGLDAAWRQAQADARAASADRDAEERRAAHPAIRSALKARTDALKTIQKAMRPVADAVRAYRAANDGIGAAIRAHSGPLGRQRILDIHGITHRDVGLDRSLVGALLWEADLNVTGIDGRAISERLERDGLAGFVGYDNDQIEFLADRLVEPEETA